MFNLCAQKDKKIPFAIKQAALITSLCTKVIECGVIEPNSHTIRSIINAYRLLDSADSTNSAKRAADARHSKADGSRDKQEKIRAVWASGKYDSRDICAEQECAALSMSFSTARKALRNTKDPT